MSLTKAGISSTLAGIYAEVCPVELVRTDSFNGKQKSTYQVGVMKVEGNRAKFFSIVFYVIDEGQAGEVAYFDMDRAPTELQV